MIIKKKASMTAVGGALLSLALVAGPSHAQDTEMSDPEVIDGAAADTAMTAEEAEMAAEKAGEEAEEMAADAADELEEAGDAVEENVDAAAETVADAMNDDPTAEMISQRIGTEPSLGMYALDVTEIDGRYSVNGMIDKSEDYTLLEELLRDVEGVDPEMIDNNVVQN